MFVAVFSRPVFLIIPFFTLAVSLLHFSDILGIACGISPSRQVRLLIISSVLSFSLGRTNNQEILTITMCWINSLLREICNPQIHNDTDPAATVALNIPTVEYIY